MAAFKSIDWNNLLEMEAPWVPQPDDNMDTTYFEGKISHINFLVSNILNIFYPHTTC
jgi:hypothetical protein